MWRGRGVDQVDGMRGGGKKVSVGGENRERGRGEEEEEKEEVWKEEVLKRMIKEEVLKRGVNIVFITLIPKIRDCTKVKDFRPISLINCLFKIFSKILANRLSHHMSSLVASSQSAFQAGKSTLDSILQANEMIHACSRRKKEVAMFKIDFAKAFDSIDWVFLIDLLRARGFGSRWCSWILHIISSSSCAILVNGSPTKFFSCKRGLKQGDPLSPMLFNIAVDVLYKMIMNNAEEGLLSSLGLKHPLNHLRILQFADDTLLFVKSSYHDISILKTILYIFEDISGLSINYSKSSLVYFGNIQHKDHDIAYGKTDSKSFKFLANWKKVCLNKEEGGLGVKDIALFNTSLLSKWLWKCLDRNSTSGNFLHHLYVHNGTKLQNSSFKSSNSSFWNDVLSKKDAFLHNIKWIIGSGEDIRFWEDKWVNFNSLASIFPESYKLAFSANASIRSQGSYIDNEWQWHLLMRRSILPNAQAEKIDLLKTVSDFLASNNCDQPTWSLTSNRQFSVRHWEWSCSPENQSEAGGKPHQQKHMTDFRMGTENVHPDIGISSKAMGIMNSFINDIFEKLAQEASRLARYNKKPTITSREIQTSVRLVLPGELAKHAVSEGTKAVTKFTSS
ncbi:uncharacterized protein LOC109846609 [Asparagus officinalis]|nr:uncharacterized protein LOC109846609 [Asparagus officinalis]